jgi:hypothetical protein
MPPVEALEELAPCSVRSFFQLDLEKNCNHVSPFGAQINGLERYSGYQIQLFDIYYGSRSIGVSSSILEVEKLSLDSSDSRFSENFFFAAPVLIGLLGQYNQAEPAIGFKVLKQVFWVPTALSNLKLHYSVFDRSVSVFQGFNTDVFFTDRLGVISKSSSGIEFGAGEGIYFTASFSYNKRIFNTFGHSGYQDSFGLSGKVWLAAW